MINDLKNWFEFNPPFAATREDWQKFRARFKTEAPIRYYLNQIIGFIKYRPKNKLNDLVWWIRHRTTDRSHIINTGLAPGYYDADTMVLHGVFSILKDFIEIECAHMYRILSPWRSRVMDNKRCGLEYMKKFGKSDENEKPSSLQAPHALLEAYDYWTAQRLVLVQALERLRESHELSGDNFANEYFKKKRTLDRMDTLNLQKIIKNRQIMWT